MLKMKYEDVYKKVYKNTYYIKYMVGSKVYFNKIVFNDNHIVGITEFIYRYPEANVGNLLSIKNDYLEIKDGILLTD